MGSEKETVASIVEATDAILDHAQDLESEISRLRAENERLYGLVTDLASLIQKACPDASWWVDELADRCDAARFTVREVSDGE